MLCSISAAWECLEIPPLMLALDTPIPRAVCRHIPVWLSSQELGTTRSLCLPLHWFPAVKSFGFAQTSGISAPALAFCHQELRFDPMGC